MTETTQIENPALTAEDLEAAVEEGILSADQSARLQAFVANAQGRAVAFVSTDEPFRFVRGFRDVFIAIGLMLLFFGIAGTVVAMTGNPFWGDSSDNALQVILFALMAGLAWMTGELITARLRLPLSSIVVVSAFAAASGTAGPLGMMSIFPGAGEDHGELVAGGVSILATAFYYARFRLPYALLPIAGAGVLIVVSLANAISPGAPQAHATLVFGLAGLLLFAAAMVYDMRDPRRITRYAECAFWLHLLAAPLIVHSVINAIGDISALSNESALSIVAIIAVIGLIALVIDRRALLVSTLLYLGIVVGFALESSGLSGDKPFFVTLAILGTFALTLGLGWMPLRRFVFRLIPQGQIKQRLPNPL